ncbi:PAS domain-containing protein [Qipengyuania vesicularis]|uniref:PAS domain-containing protein n=1 Tax=Qipengyuania vesicularis TaxID=2867232 RepID=UPI001C86D291|nr:PAS domain-containing protein [Qipengyuania vesicularis]MBX7527991.1 PAS domain-containing protein [Qipengyuania vesicularis]
MPTSQGSNWPVNEPPSQHYCGEDERLTVLATYGGQDLVGDEELQQIAQFAAKLCDTPMATVTLVEKEHQRFLARFGMEEETTPRPTSFCAHAMLGTEPMVICDAQEDPLFADNPLVTGEPHIRFYAGHPLISAEGAPLGALCVIDTEPRSEGLTDLQREGLAVLAQSVMRRLGQRRLGRHVNQTLENQERELRRMIDSVPGIAWRADDQGNFTYVNARWRELTGIEPPATTEDWKRAIHPEDWEATLARFLSAVETEGLFEDEWRLKLADGSYCWVQSRAVPVITEGQPTSWFGTVIDVDKAHRISESRDLLARELSHRIKNIFAVVSGLIAIRSRGKDEVQDFARDLSETVRALGTAHDYVRPLGGRQGETLSGLLADLLAPYDSPTGERFTISGPGVKIGQRAATPLALIFHELATNSAKYGALSCAEGKVVVTVEDSCEADETVCVIWDEVAIPCGFTPPDENEGFGSRLLRMAIESQLGGSFERSYSEDGLEVRIVFPRRNILD